MKTTYLHQMMFTGMIAGFMTFSTYGQQRSVDLELRIDEPADASALQPDASVPFSLSLSNHGLDDEINLSENWIIYQR